MEVSLLVYLICLGSLVVFTTWVSLVCFNSWEKPGARVLGFLMTSMAIWSGFYVLEILQPELNGKILSRQILYLGMALSPPLWLVFAMEYTEISEWWLKKGRAFLLSVPGIAVFILGLTNEQHHLIWKTITAPVDPIGALQFEYGPAFWAYTVLANLYIGAGCLIYVLDFYRNQNAFRIKAGIMLAGVLITTLTNLLFLIFNFPSNVDPTPLSFALSAPLIVFGFFRFGMSSLLPLAAGSVVDQFRDVMIIVNPKDRITDMNRAAMDFLEIDHVPDEASIFQLFPQAHLLKEIWEAPETSLKLGVKNEDHTNWFEARVTPLFKNEKDLLGRLIVLHDITGEQYLLKVERRRAQQLALLEEIGRNIADSFDEKDILQRAINAIIHRFGHALASISVLKEEDILEIIAISGTRDFGYAPGFKQKMGEGIIGHTAISGKTYLTDNVSRDPHYFSTQLNSGSAIATPIIKQEKLYGVLYVESLEPKNFDQVDVKTLETLASQISASLQRASLHAQTQENLNVLATLQNISKAISSSLDMEIIASKVVNGLHDAFGYSHVSIYLLEEDYLYLAGEVGYPHDMKIEKIHISQGVCGRTIRTKAVQFIEDTSLDEVFLKAAPNIASEICVPLLKDDIVLGTLNVESSPARKLTRHDVELLSTIAGPIAVAVDNARLHAQIKKLATTDAVTGLSNRHVFENTLAAEVERAQRAQVHVSLIVFDIDSFKEYNDKWGHPAGDSRLKAMGTIVKNNLRKYDIAARYGGDEFAIILADSNRENALGFAKRLHQAAQAGAEDQPVEGLGIPGYTLSMGIATFPEDASTQAELLIAADNAALRAKHLGKNRIQLASEMNHDPS